LQLQLSENNRLLFHEQVQDHVEKLNDLMALSAGSAIEEGSVRKACLATKLLEGSTSMLGLEEWSGTLTMLRELLDMSSRSSACWGEQLSQVVSEVLETEEHAIKEIITPEAGEIDLTSMFGGLQREMEYLLKECESTGSAVRETDGEIEIASDVERQSDGFLEDFSTLDRLIDSLNGVRDRFSMYLEDPERRSDIVKNLELAFGESEFFVDLIGDILSRLGDVDRRFLSKVSCSTVLDGVRDFFYLHARIKGWNAQLVSRIDDFSLDRDAASALAVILEGCLFDVCKLSGSEKDLRLEAKVDITGKGTFLLATLSDEYGNFLRDSKLDREDVFAFYPSLRNIRSLLEKRGGLMWIEPDTAKGERFRFTLPITVEKTDYHIFSASGRKLAIPCHSVECVLASEKTDIKTDSLGGYVMISGTRVPVYALEELAPDEIDSKGSHGCVMVIGVAEKRAGIYTDLKGKRMEGVIDQLTEGEWSSLMKEVLNVGEDEYPILDVLLVMKRIAFLQGFEDNLEETGTFVDDGKEIEEEEEEITVPRV
jgi:hypothetical protein